MLDMHMATFANIKLNFCPLNSFVRYFHRISSTYQMMIVLYGVAVVVVISIFKDLHHKFSTFRSNEHRTKGKCSTLEKCKSEEFMCAFKCVWTSIWIKRESKVHIQSHFRVEHIYARCLKIFVRKLPYFYFIFLIYISIRRMLRRWN